MTIELHQLWEQELHAGHRWGRVADKERGACEHARLLALWHAISTDDSPAVELLNQIIAIEFCNWRITESLLAICRGIGANMPAPFAIGHIGSCSEERWRLIWAYYLAARSWLPAKVPSGIGAMLSLCDSDGATDRHVTTLLGARTTLKERYVERFCLELEYWLHGWYDMNEGGVLGLRAAVAAIEEEIRRLDPEAEAMLWAMHPDNGGLFPCLHKLFRRFDILLAGIGGGKWHAGMVEDGGSRAERVATNERYLTPIAAWVAGDPVNTQDGIAQAVYVALGTRTPRKLFLASLLVSLLRAQLIAIGG